MGGNFFYGEDEDEDEDVYAKLVRKMNSLRVEIDNDACDFATVIRVECVYKHGTLLDVVQVLIDLNLIIIKAYISSDGCWFMDVFNVTDGNGNKIWDKEVLSNLQRTLEGVDLWKHTSTGSSYSVLTSERCTSIELTGTNRPGLLSEVSAVLRDLQCNVVKADMWTHNNRAAAIVRVTEESTGLAIKEHTKISNMKKLLCNVLNGDDSSKRAKMSVSFGHIHTERRLHQMMVDDTNYEMKEPDKDGVKEEKSRPQVAVMHCAEKDYTVVILKSIDRPKLLFDTLCTLTDLQYVVYHGTVDTGNIGAYQEYYIRHVNGLPISSEVERQRVIKCLAAAIERRSSEGLELEVSMEDRVGLLSDITRVLHENGLTIRRAKISTEGGRVLDTFYVSDMSGNPVDTKTIDSISSQIGRKNLEVKNNPFPGSTKPSKEANSAGFLFGNFLRACSFQSLRLIRSYS